MTTKLAILAHRRGETNDELADAWRTLGIDAHVLEPALALSELDPGELVLGRIDVLETLDGVEPGLAELDELVDRGVRVLNRPDALRAAHDKLVTAGRLEAARLPHPGTAHLEGADRRLTLPLPVVVKPRYGSWGRDVFRCETEQEFTRCLDTVADRSWFRRHGAIVQELLPMPGYDLRLVVAGGRVAGAAERVAQPGEWRTNVSLGAELRPARLDATARSLGVAAAAAIGADLVGVDLAPTESGWFVLELNGAVDFDGQYSIGANDVYAEIASAFGLLPTGSLPSAGRR